MACSPKAGGGAGRVCKACPFRKFAWQLNSHTRSFRASDGREPTSRVWLLTLFLVGAIGVYCGHLLH